MFTTIKADLSPYFATLFEGNTAVVLSDRTTVWLIANKTECSRFIVMSLAYTGAKQFPHHLLWIQADTQCPSVNSVGE